MQVMPDTYDGLRGRYNLGNDPFDPHNNILAGTAYLREMYDRYGAPGFLAAYNAGPNRLDSYLYGGRPLPDETVNYVASIAPLLGPGTPMSGPLAVYAVGSVRLAAQTTATGCDPDAAYDPARPCVPLKPAVSQPVVLAAGTPASVFATSYRQGACDPDAAYDPSRPCQPARRAPVMTVAYTPTPATPTPGDCDPDAAYDPTRRCQPAPAAAAPAPVVAQALPPADTPSPDLLRRPYAPRVARFATGERPLQERMAQPVAFTPGPPPGLWGIQVGAFANLATAEAAAENARAAIPDLLRTAKIELPATTPFGSQVAFRARLFGLSQSAAANACSRLSGRGWAFITVPPPHDVHQHHIGSAARGEAADVVAAERPGAADGRGVEQVGAVHRTRIAGLGAGEVGNQPQLVQHVVWIGVCPDTHIDAGALIAAEIFQRDASAREHGGAVGDGGPGFGEAGEVVPGVPRGGRVIIEENAVADDGASDSRPRWSSQPIGVKPWRRVISWNSLTDWAAWICQASAAGFGFGEAVAQQGFASRCRSGRGRPCRTGGRTGAVRRARSATSASVMAFSPAASFHSYSTRWPFLVNQRAERNIGAMQTRMPDSASRSSQPGCAIDRSASGGDAGQQEFGERDTDAMRHRLGVGAEDRQVFVQRGIVEAGAADFVGQALVHRLAGRVASGCSPGRASPSCRRRR